MKSSHTSLLQPALLRRALLDSVRKLDPRAQLRNPVMFVVWVGALAVTAIVVRAPSSFHIQIALWLWFTVLFANFAEAMAEGRGKAQAAALRRMRVSLQARRWRAGRVELLPAASLQKGDEVECTAGDVIPADGEVIEGVASVDEAAITGESAPVIRESGGDRSAVTAGTRVISDRILIRVTCEPGQTFLDRMIALVEGSQRGRTPNEKALGILLVGLTIVFLLAVATLPAFVRYAEREGAAGSGELVSLPVLISLLVCLIPTTIGGLLSAIGISGIDRLSRRNVLATSGRAVEAAGDVDVLLLDKTGTITMGNRMAVEFRPARGVEPPRLADAAQLASLADETPEGRSVVVLAKENFGLRGRDLAAQPAHFIPFTAQTRMSGVDLPSGDGRSPRRHPQGRGRCHPPPRGAAGGRVAGRRGGARGHDRRTGRHAARGVRGPDRAGRHLPEGRGEGRHPRALRATAPHGHPHRDDYGRQPGHRGRHRGGGGRG
jgi:K+-transporting ATPase ATPase B chain